MRATGPLFQFDPGWLFIVAGLSVCAAGVLLPAQADLRALEDQLAQLQAEEARAYQRLAAHADFIDQVERSEPAMIKRLAATQLNLVPQGDTPLLLAAAETAPVTGWIDSTLKPDMRPPPPELLSMLSRWTNGPSRLWLFGGGIMAVFMGVLIGPGSALRRIRRAQPAGVGAVVGVSGWDTAGSETIAVGLTQPAMRWLARDDSDDVAAASAASARMGRIDLWSNHHESDGHHDHPAHDEAGEHDISIAPIGVLASATSAAIDVEDDREFEMADTVDLEPDEVAVPSSTRVVIDDSRRHADTGRAARDAAASAVTLTAREVEANLSPEASGGGHTADDDSAEPVDASPTIIDAREGLGAGTSHQETVTLMHETDGNDAGTGLLDAVDEARGERADDSADDWAVREAVDPTPPAAQHPTDDDGAEKNARGRRRPRRAKRRSIARDDAPAEHDIASVAASVDQAAIEPDGDATPAASVSTSDGDDDDGDGMSPEAIAIPFLRTRVRSGRPAAPTSDADHQDDEDSTHRALKSRARPRRRR